MFGLQFPPKPDWDFWLDVPAPYVWECVALAFDWEPRSIKLAPSADGELIAHYANTPYFGQLLEKAAVHASVGGELYPFLLEQMGEKKGIFRQVPLWRFGAWVVSRFPWSLPAKFPLPAEPTAHSETPESAEPTATNVLNGGEQGVTKAEILATEWPMPNGAPSLESILDKIPKWVETACIKIGRPGKGVSGSHLWVPSQLGICLATRTPHKQWKCNKQALTKHIQEYYFESMAEWESKSEDV